MSYSLEILSPVHIGSGDKYNQASFFEENNYIFVFDPSIFLGLLPDNIKRKIIETVENRGVLTLQSFLDNSLKTKLKKGCLYSIPVKSIVDINSIKEIEEIIKKKNEIFIPGSEIKGALRTAILYKLLMNDYYKLLEDRIKELENLYLPQVIRKKIKNTLESEFEKNNNLKISDLSKNKKEEVKKQLKRKNKEICEKIDKIAGEINKICFRGFKDDAKYDFLKLLQVSDSEYKRIDEKTLFIGKTIVLSSKGLLPFAIFQEFLNYNGLKFKMHTLDFQGLNNSDLLFKSLGFKDKQKEFIKGLPQIFEASYEFANELIVEEEKYFRNSNLNDEKKNIILHELNTIKSSNSKDTPVLRIGMGQGFESLTMWLAIKKHNESLYKSLLGISSGTSFSKSRKLYEDEKGNFHTLGWVRIISE